jgi:hypothetical protein
MEYEQKTQQVPYTVMVPQQYQQTVNVTRYVSKQVPYTVTRCVPRVVETQVPVKVCCPTVSSCCQ